MYAQCLTFLTESRRILQHCAQQVSAGAIARGRAGPKRSAFVFSLSCYCGCPSVPPLSPPHLSRVLSSSLPPRLSVQSHRRPRLALALLGCSLVTAARRGLLGPTYRLSSLRSPLPPLPRTTLSSAAAVPPSLGDGCYVAWTASGPLFPSASGVAKPPRSEGVRCVTPC